MKRLYQTDPLDFNSITRETLVPSKEGTVSEVSTRMDSRDYCSYARAIEMSAHKLAMYEAMTASSTTRPVTEFRLLGIDRVFVLHEKSDFHYSLVDGERVVVYSHDLAEKPLPKYTIPEVIAEPLKPFEDWRFSHSFPSKGWDPAMPPEVERLYGHLPEPVEELPLFSREEIPPKISENTEIESKYSTFENREDYFSKKFLRDKTGRLSGEEFLAELARLREDPIAALKAELRARLREDPLTALQARVRAEQKPENLEAKTKAARITVQGMQVLDENGNVKFQAVYGPEALGLVFR